MKTSLSCCGVVLGATRSWTVICPAGLLWPSLQSGHSAADFSIYSVCQCWHMTCQPAACQWPLPYKALCTWSTLSPTHHYSLGHWLYPSTDFLWFICHENEENQNGEVNNSTFELFWSEIIKYNSKVLYVSMLSALEEYTERLKLNWCELDYEWKTLTEGLKTGIRPVNSFWCSHSHLLSLIWCNYLDNSLNIQWESWTLIKLSFYF